MKRALALFSGGKDSTYALHLAYLRGIDIVLLTTFIPRARNPWTIHRPLAEYGGFLARNMGFNHESIVIEALNRNEEEKELKLKIEELVHKYEVDCIVAGVLGSYAQRMFLLEVSKDLGVDLYTPLWGRDRSAYLFELIENGIEFIITSITTWGLPPELFLGKIVTLDMAKEIVKRAKIYGFDPAFEGGEAETFTVNAPLYRSRVCLDYRTVIVSDTEGYIEPEKVYLCNL